VYICVMYGIGEWPCACTVLVEVGVYNMYLHQPFESGAIVCVCVCVCVCAGNPQRHTVEGGAHHDRAGRKHALQ
jgi:hypothetical protein